MTRASPQAPALSRRIADSLQEEFEAQAAAEARCFVVPVGIASRSCDTHSAHSPRMHRLRAACLCP